MIFMKRYVIIENIKYDITNFDHPGGNVINYLTDGRDATDAYKEFHFRSKKADMVLKTLPNEKVERCSDDRELLDAFTKFRDELIKDGFFEPSHIHVLYRIIELVMLFCLGLYTMSSSYISTVLILGMFRVRCGWLQHEGGHNSLTGIMTIDKKIQDICIGIGLHLSGKMFNKMHNKHHTTPQKEKYDVDLDTTPLVAFFDGAVETNRVRTYSSLWLRYQAYTFLPITCGIFMPLFWTLYLHPRQLLRDGNLEQFVYMILSHAIPIFSFIFYSNVSINISIVTSLASSFVAYMYMFGHIALSHTFTPIIPHDENPSLIRYATEHSVDIGVSNPFISWVMGYSNFQVIHHLFPSMPEYRSSEVSKRWIRFCEKHGLVYTRIGYFEAWKKLFQNLNQVGHVYNNKNKNK
jgi:fatty acid desaturase